MVSCGILIKIQNYPIVLVVVRGFNGVMWYVINKAKKKKKSYHAPDESQVYPVCKFNNAA